MLHVSLVPFFLFPNSQPIPKAQNIVFSKVSATFVFPVPFCYSVIRNLFQTAQNIVFSQVGATSVLSVPIFPIH